MNRRPTNKSIKINASVHFDDEAAEVVDDGFGNIDDRELIDKIRSKLSIGAQPIIDDFYGKEKKLEEVKVTKPPKKKVAPLPDVNF